MVGQREMANSQVFPSFLRLARCAREPGEMCQGPAVEFLCLRVSVGLPHLPGGQQMTARHLSTTFTLAAVFGLQFFLKGKRLAEGCLRLLRLAGCLQQPT